MQEDRIYWGIYQHHVCRRPTGGGTVARPCCADGAARDQYNYGGLTPERIYKLESAADRYVDRLYRGRLAAARAEERKP